MVINHKQGSFESHFCINKFLDEWYLCLMMITLWIVPLVGHYPWQTAFSGTHKHTVNKGTVASHCDVTVSFSIGLYLSKKKSHHEKRDYMLSSTCIMCSFHLLHRDRKLLKVVYYNLNGGIYKEIFNIFLLNHCFLSYERRMMFMHILIHTVFRVYGQFMFLAIDQVLWWLRQRALTLT